MLVDGCFGASFKQIRRLAHSPLAVSFHPLIPPFSLDKGLQLRDNWRIQSKKLVALQFDFSRGFGVKPLIEVRLPFSVPSPGAQLWPL